MILDYSHHLTTSLKPRHSRPPLPSSFYFSKSDCCLFCGIKLSTRFSDAYRTGPGNDYVGSRIDVSQCVDCGWWEVFEASESNYLGDFAVWGASTAAILREFEEHSPNVPLELLRKELLNRPNLLYDIHSKKMEELAASVLREHYACSVEVCGKSHDGGFDLLLVDGDSPWIGQVKRRQTPDKVESVEEIRKLLGVALLRDASGCVFVTTARRFSRNALFEAMLAVTKGIVTRFELLDVGRFLDIMKLHPPPVDCTEHWKQVVSKTWSKRLG